MENWRLGLKAATGPCISRVSEEDALVAGSEAALYTLTEMVLLLVRAPGGKTRETFMPFETGGAIVPPSLEMVCTLSIAGLLSSEQSDLK